MCDKLRIDRCVDLFRKPGEKGHYGKNLRRVFDSLIKKFPDLPPDSRICASCRKKAYNLSENNDTTQANTSSIDDWHNDVSLTSDNDEENLHSRVSPKSKVRSQREIDLEEMLDELNFG